MELQNPQKKKSWKKGDEVEAEWEDKFWYPAIIKDKAKKEYLVEYPEFKDPPVWLTDDKIRPRPETKNKNESGVQYIDSNELKKKKKNESVTVMEKKKKEII